MVTGTETQTAYPEIPEDRGEDLHGLEAADRALGGRPGAFLLFHAGRAVRGSFPRTAALACFVRYVCGDNRLLQMQQWHLHVPSWIR